MPLMLDEFLGLGTAGWTAILTFVTSCAVIAAGFATRAAFGQIRAAESARIAQMRPYVVVDLEPAVHTRAIVELVIRNAGRTAARGVELSFTPEPQRAQEVAAFPLREMRLLKQPTPVMPPGREIRVLFDVVQEYASKRGTLPATYTVTVKYTDDDAQQWVDTYVLDLDVHVGALYVEPKGLHQLVVELEKVRKALETGR
jgi:hypothetical protein